MVHGSRQVQSFIVTVLVPYSVSFDVFYVCSHLVYYHFLLGWHICQYKVLGAVQALCRVCSFQINIISHCRCHLCHYYITYFVITNKSSVVTLVIYTIQKKIKPKCLPASSIRHLQLINCTRIQFSDYFQNIFYYRWCVTLFSLLVKVLVWCKLSF